MPPQAATPAPPSPQDIQAQSHGTANPAAASDDVVSQFLSLDEPTRTQLMSSWSDEKKQYMLAGLQSRNNRQAAAAPAPTEPPSNSFVHGFGSHLIDAVTGLPHTFDVAGMTPEQQKEAALSGNVPKPPTPNPPHYGPLTDALAGRYREALGGAAFDALSLWAGKKLAEAPSARQAGNKISMSSGADVDPIRQVLPDIQQTVAKAGGPKAGRSPYAPGATHQPQTIDDLNETVKATNDRLADEFDRDFAPIAKQRIYTPVIKQRLQDILDKNPQWAKTPDGQAKIAAIKSEMNTYNRTGWTFEEMNKERSDLRTQVRGLQGMSSSDAAATIKRDADIAAKTAVADVMSDTVNDWTASHGASAGLKSKAYYDDLRQKQKTLIDLEDTLDDRITELHNKQATHEGLGPVGRMKFHAYVSPASSSALRAHLSGLKEMLSAGPEAEANAQVRAGFASSKHPIAGGAVMALPVSALNDGAAADQKSTVPPPPTP